MFLGKSLQEGLVNAGVPQGLILGPTLSLLYLKTFLMVLPAVLCCMLMLPLSVARAGLELASQIKSNLQDTLDVGKKWLVHSILEKLNWFYLVNPITIVTLM